MQETQTIYGKDSQRSTNLIDINKIKFDVLELDCEGAEVEILLNLKVRPKYIIVEFHPILREYDFNKLIQFVENDLEYEIKSIRTVSGYHIPNSDKLIYFSESVISDPRLFSDIDFIIDHYLVYSFKNCNYWD